MNGKQSLMFHANSTCLTHLGDGHDEGGEDAGGDVGGAGVHSVGGGAHVQAYQVGPLP